MALDDTLFRPTTQLGPFASPNPSSHFSLTAAQFVRAQLSLNEQFDSRFADVDWSDPSYVKRVMDAKVLASYKAGELIGNAVVLGQQQRDYYGQPGVALVTKVETAVEKIQSGNGASLISGVKDLGYVAGLTSARDILYATNRIR